MIQHIATLQKNYIFIWQYLEVGEINTFTNLFVVQDAVPFGGRVKALFFYIDIQGGSADS